MALQLNISEQILGQVATAITTYCYLYEPLKISISEGNGVINTKVFIDLIVTKTEDQSTVVETLLNYGEFDINPAEPLTVDLMKIARQHHNADVYKFANIDDLVSDTFGWKAVISEYVYEFKITSDASNEVVRVKKLPIIGGRDFTDFTPAVPTNQDLTEAEQGGFLTSYWLNGFKNYPFVFQSLVNPTNNDARPNLGKGVAFGGTEPCGGYIIWKSPLGGWLQWGFKIGSESNTKQYIGNIATGLFESTDKFGGNPYVGANYTGITTKKSRKLKALSLTADELKFAASIINSPAVYYMNDSTGTLELMRLSSASAPQDNLANGGDFSVSLSSISSTNQKIR